MKNIFLSIFAISVLAACGATTGATKLKVGTAQVSVVNTQWQLAGYSSKGKVPTLVIEGGKLSGQAPCNRYFGELILDPKAGDFSASNIGATRMACENLSEESNYIEMLKQANKYVVNGNTLELYRDNLLLVKFNKL